MHIGNTLPQILVAQLGARMHYAVPVLLHRAGMLAHFYTDAYVGPGSSWHLLAQIAGLMPVNLQPSRLRRLLARRANGLPAHKVTAFNLLGLAYTQALKKAASYKERLRVYLEYGRRFEEQVVRRGFGWAKAVYAFQGAAWRILEAAKRQGLAGILEKFIAPVKIQSLILKEEQTLWPGWEEPLPPEEALARAYEVEQQEWEAADLILCPSEFVRQGMVRQGVPEGKLRLVPYGYEPPTAIPLRRPWDGKRPLRLLFVGAVTLRKGLPYLALALQQLRGLPLEARVVGPVALEEPGRARLAAVARLTGQVPRPEVAGQYQWADVFVFPSLCEGSATVIYEALAAGLPVITTPHAGSVVRNGEDGFIVPIRDAAALAEKIELLSAEPEMVAWMSQKARQRARDFSLERYGNNLFNTLISCISY